MIISVVDVSAIWEAPSLSFACKLEYFIKRKLSHAQKQQIVSTPEKLKEYIPDGLEVKKAPMGSKIVVKENI